MKSIKFRVFLTVFFISTGNIWGQTGDMVIPKETQYSILPNEAHSHQIVFIHPDGDVWISQNSTIKSEGRTIELPSRMEPTSLCWTNAGILVVFFNDTIYSLDHSQMLHPLAIVEAKSLIIQPFGKTDFSFCGLGDTIVFRYEMMNNTLDTILTYPHTITDFIVDDEDIFFASGPQVIAYLKEKQYLPIFQNSSPVRSIAFCGKKSMLFSDMDGLWLTDNNRQRTAISHQLFVDIVTDSRGQGLFKTANDCWIYVYPITNYEKTKQ